MEAEAEHRQRWRSARSWPPTTKIPDLLPWPWPHQPLRRTPRKLSRPTAEDPRRLRPGHRDPRGAGPGGRGRLRVVGATAAAAWPAATWTLARAAANLGGQQGQHDGLSERSTTDGSRRPTPRAQRRDWPVGTLQGVDTRSKAEDRPGDGPGAEKPSAWPLPPRRSFRTDSALDPLRQREDFKKLLEELEKKSPAKPEKKP